MLAGGYSNEFGGTLTLNSFPWVAKFLITKTMNELEWGEQYIGLPGYQVLEVNFYLGKNKYEFYAFLRPPLTCGTVPITL